MESKPLYVKHKTIAIWGSGSEIHSCLKSPEELYKIRDVWTLHLHTLNLKFSGKSQGIFLFKGIYNSNA